VTTRFDTKIAIVLREGLAGWQRLNVTAFLTSGVTAARPDLVGEPYADGDGTAYLALLGQPVLVLEADAATLAAARERAVARGLDVAVFTAQMFATGNDVDNRAVVRAVAAADLEVVGLGLHGPRNAVDKAVKGARLHP
jgi:hypothetical protein